MKVVLIVLLHFGLLIPLSSFGYEKWDIKASNSFKRTENVSISVDMSKCDVFDLPIDEFLESANTVVNRRDDCKLLLKRFESRIIKKLKRHPIKGLSCVDETDSIDSQYTMKILIEEINEKGGLEGSAILIEKSSNKAKIMPISLTDGRWNSSANLLLETADKLAVILANKLQYLKGVQAKPYDW